MKNIANKNNSNTDVIVNNASASSYFSIPVLFCALYLLVHFIPDLGSNDPIGPQWLYLSLLNIITAVYIFYSINQYKKYIPTIISSGYFIFFKGYLLWITASLSYAINYTETIVCLSRIFTTFFAIFNLLVIVNENKEVVKKVLTLLLLILLFESLQVLLNFISNSENYDLDNLILSLYGNHGNKNILSASIAIKIPFALYFFYTSKGTLKKWLSILLLFIAITSLFILNTRSTFLSLGVYFVLLLIYIIANKKAVKQKLVNILFIMLILSSSILISNLLIANVKNNTNARAGSYNNVLERFKSIGFDETGSSGRIKLWKHAFDYFKNHKIIGCGYGNWKLASIPYDKIDLSSFTMSYHVHNEFIEILAETGIVGFVFYAFMFAMLLFYILKSLFKNKNEHTKTVSFFVLLGLIGYLIDALLNFPSERTIIQTLLIFVTVIILQISIFEESAIASKISNLNGRFFYVLFMLIIITLIYVNYQVNQSLKYQKIIFSEFGVNPTIPTSEVADIPLNIPNLSSTAFPIKQALARYYIRDKDYKTALTLINNSEKDNPFLFYGDFLKTYIYGTQGNQDSSYYYAKKAFYERPKTLGYFQNIMVIATQKKDTLEMDKAFKEFRKNRNEAIAWVQYIQSLYYINGKPTNLIKVLCDSAIYYYPKDTALNKIQTQLK
jgi:O-antigen ligase